MEAGGVNPTRARGVAEYAEEESVYQAALARVLERRGFHVDRQPPIRFEYEVMVVLPRLRASA
jgi:hypothetical protein